MCTCIHVWEHVWEGTHVPPQGPSSGPHTGKESAFWPSPQPLQPRFQKFFPSIRTHSLFRKHSRNYWLLIPIHPSSSADKSPVSLWVAFSIKPRVSGTVGLVPCPGSEPVTVVLTPYLRMGTHMTSASLTPLPMNGHTHDLCQPHPLIYEWAHTRPLPASPPYLWTADI